MVTRLRKSEHGIALLTVMMGIALITLLVIDFTGTVVFARLSATNQANELRAYYLARSGVAIGLALLAKDARLDEEAQKLAPANGQTQQTQSVDTLHDIWAVPTAPVQVDGGTASFFIVDEDRKINLNLLVNPHSGALDPITLGMLTRLFALLGLPPEIIPDIAEWIGPANNLQLEGGAGMDFYMKLRPPYSPRFSPMPSIGDLKLVRGIDEVTFQRLRQFLTVYGQSQQQTQQQINANTAPPEVIASLSPELAANAGLVKQIILYRTIKPFSQSTDITNLPGVSDQLSEQLAKVLTTRSNYFTINAMGSFSGSRKMVNATFHRQQNGVSNLASWHEE